MSIEIVGISSYPSGNGTWWGPDGKPLATPPCDRPVERVEAPDHDVREIVARIHGIPKGATLNWHPNDCRSQRTSVTRKGGQLAEELQTVIGQFARGLAACDVHFDVSMGEWSTEQAWDG